MIVLIELIIVIFLSVVAYLFAHKISNEIKIDNIITLLRAMKWAFFGIYFFFIAMISLSYSVGAPWVSSKSELLFYVFIIIPIICVVGGLLAYASLLCITGDIIIKFIRLNRPFKQELIPKLMKLIYKNRKFYSLYFRIKGISLDVIINIISPQQLKT